MYNLFPQSIQCLLTNTMHGVRGSVHHSTIHKELHVQQPSTYEKPEAASAVLGS